MRIKYDELVGVLANVLMKYGFDEDMAVESAKIFADNSVDGVYSHGVNRFARVVEYIKKGYIKPNVKARMVESFGCIERWDGQLGMGNTNAKQCMNRALELAKEYGIGCVAIKNTNHWMRGGAYGWQAADAGCIGICWTNTMPNMPAWGAKDRRIGNNPFIMAIPRANGQHVVLDFAMAQYSYGKIEESKLSGKELPYPGGFDEEGKLSTNAAAIEKTWRVLPIGYWKGSGMSIALDMIAAVLSGGNSVAEVGKLEGGDEYGLSQVLIAINPEQMIGEEERTGIIDGIIEDVKLSQGVENSSSILYPGERSWMNRQKNLEKGIPVVESVWETILSL